MWKFSNCKRAIGQHSFLIGYHVVMWHVLPLIPHIWSSVGYWHRLFLQGSSTTFYKAFEISSALSFWILQSVVLELAILKQVYGEF